MRTPFVALLALALVPLSLPVASAGVAETAACSLYTFTFTDPTLDRLWYATTVYACTVGGIVAEQGRGVGCFAVEHPFGGPVGQLVDATQAYKCAVVTILV